MMTKLTTCGSLILVAVLGLGCGGGGGTTTTVATFCDQLATKACDTKAADNCGATATACKATQTAACMTWAAGIQLAFPTTRPFNTSKIGACQDKTVSVFNKSPIVPADRAEISAACERVFSGAKKKAEACTNDYECDSSLICDPLVLVCAPKTNLNKGDFCGTTPGALCGTGLYCTIAAGGAVKTCVARKVVGEVCTAADPCLETLRCDVATGMCKARADLNEACTVDSDCLPAAPYCDPNFAPTTCDTGFIPNRNAAECSAFGATPGSLGAGGAKGGVGGAAGGASGGLGGAGGATL